jgi:hypothetical protein
MIANTLSQLRQQNTKRVFDAADKNDLRLYKEYLQTRSWGRYGCPFVAEWPWLSVPDMIAHKISMRAVEEL